MDRLGGMIADTLLVDRDTRLTGMVAGDVVVAPGCRLICDGMVSGDIILREGATLQMDGMVAGRIIHQ